MVETILELLELFIYPGGKRGDRLLVDRGVRHDQAGT
jgi:hypothetical protein